MNERRRPCKVSPSIAATVQAVRKLQKAKKLNDFLKWALTEGGASAGALDYAPLPASLSQTLIARLDSIGAK